jgi:S1-C subfamily serine protease
VGGGLAALIVVGGIVFGVIYALKDKEPRPDNSVVSGKSTTVEPAPSTPVAVFSVPSNAVTVLPKAKAQVTPKAAPPIVTKNDPEEIPDEPTPIGSQKTPKKPKGSAKKTPEIAPDVLALTKKSTALIEAKGGWGTGFVIAPNLIMTNAHVLSGRMLDEFRVSFVSLDDTAPAPLKPTLLYVDNRRDIAILRVTTDRPPLEMVPSGTELQGMEVAIVGNPKGEAGQAQINKVTTGRLAAPVRRDAGFTYYELLCEAYFGNSGGPVIDLKSGKLVGVIQSILGDGKTKSYCIPFGEAKKAVAGLPPKEKEAEATRIATARHYLDYISERMPELERNADFAMQAQLANLLTGGGDGVTVTVTTADGKSFSMTLGELMSELKDKHATTYKNIQSVMPIVNNSSEIPSLLRQLMRERIETCGNMRGLANSRTNLETTFRKEMTARKSANDAKAKAFDKEYEKFLDSVASKATAGK